MVVYAGGGCTPPTKQAKQTNKRPARREPASQNARLKKRLGVRVACVGRK